LSAEKKDYNSITGLQSPNPFVEDLIINEVGYVKSPLVSIVMPVFNKARVISSVLSAVKVSVPYQFEIITINDASDDDSLAELFRCYKELGLNGYIVNSPTPIYETACDNVGFSLASSDHICELQSDTFLMDEGFIPKAIKLSQSENIGTISGRCCHAWMLLLRSRARRRWLLRNPLSLSLSIKGNRGVGLMGSDIYENKTQEFAFDYYLADTNCRGPWFFRKSLLDQYGLLDTDEYYLGDDDHAFNLLLAKDGKRSAYIPANVYSDLSESSTHQKRSGFNAEVYDWLKKNKPGSKKLKSGIPGLKSTKPLGFNFAN
jgi:glycosyltransferase involved in cell wall biosynthesis